MTILFTKQGRRYRPATMGEVCEEAAAHYGRVITRQCVFADPRKVREFLLSLIGTRESEVFVALWLDNRHRLIRADELFHGTIDGSTVHPREVVKAALAANAAACIIAHNHPSGVPEPSRADELITHRLRDALALVDIRLLDHIIVAPGATMSFAERGLL